MLATSSDEPADRRGRRRVGVDVALGLAHDPGLGGDVEADRAAAPDDELRRAAADVDDEQFALVARSLARGPGEGQRGLLVAADRARVEAEALADGGAELSAVGGVADRAREHRGGGRHAVLVDSPAVAPQRLEDPLDRIVLQAAGGVGAVAQARHDRLAVKLVQRAAGRHLGDQQSRRVRSDIDHRDTHSNRGYWLVESVDPAGWALLHSLAHAAGWSSLVARRAHNPKVAGSNPAPAIRKPPLARGLSCSRGGLVGAPWFQCGSNWAGVGVSSGAT